jgi:hypothetical protein
MSRALRARAALDAERADQADALADGDRELRIGAAAAGDQHGRFFERIGIRQLGHSLAASDERLHPAQHGVVQRADAQGGAEPLRDPRGRDSSGNRKHIRNRRNAVFARERDHRRKCAALGHEAILERAGVFFGACRIAAGLGQHETFRLDRGKRCGRIGPVRFDDRESACSLQRLHHIGCRGIGDDDKRTLQSHGGMRLLQCRLAACQSAVNGPLHPQFLRRYFSISYGAKVFKLPWSFQIRPSFVHVDHGSRGLKPSCPQSGDNGLPS